MTKTKCKTCGSHDPKLHPAVQYGGEVSFCSDAFHAKPTRTQIARRKEFEDHEWQMRALERHASKAVQL